MKVTITAALQPIPKTLNLYGEHNLNRELLRHAQEHNVQDLTVHVFTKEGALRAAEFCARNNLPYAIGQLAKPHKETT